MNRTKSTFLIHSISIPGKEAINMAFQTKWIFSGDKIYREFSDGHVDQFIPMGTTMHLAMNAIRNFAIAANRK